VLWLARAANANVAAETILTHAVGIGQIAARHVGAAVIALDLFDAEAEQFWRERFGFRASLTRRRDANGEERPRLCDAALLGRMSAGSRLWSRSRPPLPEQRP
jgi:hypothetical protein